MSKAIAEDRDRGWYPATAGLKVRLRDNPGRQGITTGKTRRTGSFLLVQIDFGPNEKEFKRYDQLELIDEEKDVFDLLRDGLFGGPSDLRRVLTFEKIKGELTNTREAVRQPNALPRQSV